MSIVTMIIAGVFIVFALYIALIVAFWEPEHRDLCDILFQAAVQEETEPASKVFETLDKAGIEVNYLGSKDKNNEPKEPEFKVISL